MAEREALQKLPKIVGAGYAIGAHDNTAYGSWEAENKGSYRRLESERCFLPNAGLFLRFPRLPG